MPSRIIREGIIDSRAVNSLTEQGEIFYRRLMSIVDDYGRFTADPEILRARCFPLQLDRWPLSRVSKALSDVSTVRTDDGQELVTVYAVGNKKYLQINNFQQRVRADSRFPPPSDGQLSFVCQTDDGHMTASSASRARSEAICDMRYAESESESDAEAHAESESEALPVCASLPAPIPISNTPQKPRAADLYGQTSTRFEEFWNQYPRKQRKDFACAQWISIVDPSTEGAVFACLERYLGSDEVGRGVVANPDKWLYEQHRNGWQGDWPRARGLKEHVC